LGAGFDLAAVRAPGALLAGAAFALAALAGERLACLGFAVFFAFVATSVPSFVYPSRAQRNVPHHTTRRARLLAV
jgi:hypothetical protein